MDHCTSQKLCTRLKFITNNAIPNGYIQFFNILKKTPNELIKQLTSFLYQYMHIQQKNIRHILIETELHKDQNIIQNVFNSITAYSCISCLVDIIELLVEYGANINSRIDYLQNTLLHKVACEGNKQICLHLIRRGCNIHLLNSNQKTPIDIFGTIFDRTLRRYTNSFKDECRLLFTREYNWTKRRNYILFINNVKKLFIQNKLTSISLYKFISCNDMVRYVCLFL
jgi:hypothetical protein